MLTRNKILQVLSENQIKIKEFGIERIGLFGSFSRNEQTDNSDIDFLIEFREGEKSFDNFMDLHFFLKELFNRKIDLKTSKSLPENRNFTKNVLTEVAYATF